jgi:uridine kinase
VCLSVFFTLSPPAETALLTVPIYDFVTSSRVGEEDVMPADVVILEGILTLYWEELRAMMSLKLFVDTASDTRLARRVLRDTHERGRTLENVLIQYETFVKPA